MRKPEKIAAVFSEEGQILSVVLNSPKANVLDGAMMSEISSLLDDLGRRKELKLIIIEGAGDHFSFGASVAEHLKDHAAEMLRQFHGLLLKLSALNVPVLCKVSGMCLGGAFELALAGHLIFADKTAVFGQPEVTLGVFPPPASILLPLKIGYARAEEWLITGRQIKVSDAQDAGLVNQLFETRTAMDEGAIEWARKHILPKSAVAIRYAVRAGRLQLQAALREHLPALEEMYVSELMETSDANEGIVSFLEKRKPVWQNQ